MQFPLAALAACNAYFLVDIDLAEAEFFSTPTQRLHQRVICVAAATHVRSRYARMASMLDERG